MAARSLINVSLPPASHTGWGTCGHELTAALKEVADVREPEANDYPEDYTKPLLQAIQGVSLLPCRPWLTSLSMNLGYCFIEDDLLVAKYRLHAPRYFDRIATGSSWCTDRLRDALQDSCPVGTVIQGVAPRWFTDPPLPRDDGRFIVFSGGKAETRKGQDIVIKAVRVMMDRHADVYLSCAWHNPWGAQIPGYTQIMRDAMSLPLNRILGGYVRAFNPDEMASMYAHSDVGLFCNRCEAGTNLVMMEYMAAGKPVIATYDTGHRDVLASDDPLNLLEGQNAMVTNAAGIPTGLWWEPDLDEIVEKLEFAYRRRDALNLSGKMNRERMREFTWARCAEQLLDMLVR